MHIKLTLCFGVVALLTYLVLELDACGFPMAAPVCSCGGGCGCGRRKREISQYPTPQVSSINVAFTHIIPSDRTDEIQACPQGEWLPLLVRNMNGDVRASAAAIKQVLYAKYASRFFVACVSKDKHAFVANGEGYCTVENDNIRCLVTALLA